MAAQTALGLVLKLVQVNAWMGNLAVPLARFLEAEKPDFICMQEVFMPQDNVIPAFDLQFNFLKDIREHTGLGHEYFAKAWSFQLGSATYDLGSIILSRYPMDAQTSFFPYGSYHTRTSKDDSAPNSQPWLAATISLPEGKQFALATYHGFLKDAGGIFGIGDQETIEVWRKVAARLGELARPLVFCGDFNIWPESPAFKELDGLGLRNLITESGSRGTLSEVHKAPAENRAVSTPDHMFVDENIRVQDFYVSDTLVSDHKALILEFDI